MRVIIEIPISITYLLMAIKVWLLYEKYIVYMIILYLGWTMVRALEYKWIECKNNIKKSINWSIGDQNSAWYHRKTKLYYLHFVFDICVIVYINR